MAILDVTNVQVVGFPEDTTITTVGGDYVAPAYTWFGVPRGQAELTVTPAGPALCMLIGRDRTDGAKTFIQVMTVDEIRESV